MSESDWTECDEAWEAYMREIYEDEAAIYAELEELRYEEDLMLEAKMYYDGFLI